MAKDEVFPVDENDDDVVVTIEMDDGSEVTCEILTIFDVKDQDYIALLPYEEIGKEVLDLFPAIRLFGRQDGLVAI